MDACTAQLPRICLLAAPETSPSVLYGLYDVLTSAGALYPELTKGVPGQPIFDVKIVAAKSEPFRCYADVMVEPHCSIEALDDAEVIIVCDVYQPTDTPPHGRYQAEIAWLRAMHARGSIIASVCSGSLILAEAGMLDGLEAAGHWGYRDMFLRHYPRVKMREELVLCLSGEAQRIVTAGAVFSWQELALYLIARFGTPDQAVQTAKLFLFSEHSDGQLPFAVQSPRIQTSDAAIQACQLWIAENYAVTNPVAHMAVRAGLKPRTFARRFLAATGYHPMDYVHILRVEEAKQMLETTSMPIEEVANEVGYEDSKAFQRLFKRKASLTPSAYRRKFARMAAIGRGDAAPAH